MVTTNIEAPRLEQEERLVELGFRPLVGPWHQPNAAADAVLGKLRLGVDVAQPSAVDISAELAALRATLFPKRSRASGSSVAAAHGPWIKRSARCGPA